MSKPPPLPRSTIHNIILAVVAAIGINAVGFMLFSLGYCVGQGEQWSEEAVTTRRLERHEASLLDLDQGYVMGGADATLGKYDREAFVQKWREFYAKQREESDDE